MQSLVVVDKWSEDDFKKAYSLLENHSYTVKSQDFNLEHLRDCLKKREDFMIRLLENPELLEQEVFTELMQALFHLNEELGSANGSQVFLRVIITTFPWILTGRTRHLALAWLRYMQHLKAHYPYLFSLAMRVNPFDPNASPIVR